MDENPKRRHDDLEEPALGLVIVIALVALMVVWLS